MPRAVITYHYVEQGSQQWLDDRNGKYTGSNSHKLLGGIGVLEYAKSEQSGFGGNFHTKRGHVLEDEAIELYEAIYNVKIIRNDEGMKIGYVTNSLYPGCLYSPDGVTTIPLLEVKCFAIDNHTKLIKGNIDLKILSQIHYGMLITGKRIAHLIAYNPKAEKVIDKFKVIIIRYDPAIAKNFKRILKGEDRNVQPTGN